MKVALAQMDIVWEDKEKNSKKSENKIKEAKEKGVDLILFPEMSFTGFSMNVEKIGEKREDRNQFETVEKIQKLAKKYEMAIGFGYVEKDGGMGKNHYAVVSKDGQVMSDYVKIHPFSYGGEAQYYDSGNRIEVFGMQGWKIATFICYDLRFPEIFQLASREAQAIIVAANWPESRREHWLTLLRARAIENQCYVLGVNRTGIGGGISYVGDSIVIDPYGKVLEIMKEKEGLIFCEMDREVVEEWREKFPQRKDRKLDYTVLYKTGAKFGD